MSTNRQYRLLCRIARGLDKVGDRWTLLILRDLHAGPARFTDLATGLDGIATNLLTERLRQLESDGFIERNEKEFGVKVYELTDLGLATGGVLFELARLGSHFPPTEPVHRPGNLRAIAVTMKEALLRVIDDDTELSAELVVDGEHFDINVRDRVVTVYDRSAIDPNIVVATEYEPLMAAADGMLDPDEFVANHVQLVEGTQHDLVEFLSLLGLAYRAMNPLGA